MTKKQIKTLAKEKKIRLGKGSIQLIEEEIFVKVNNLLKTAKVNLHPQVTLTAENFYLAKGKIYG